MTRDRFDLLEKSDLREQLCHELFDEITFNDTNDVIRPVYTVEIFFGLTVASGFQALFLGAYQFVIPVIVGDLNRVGLSNFAAGIANAIDSVFPDGIPEDMETFDDIVEAKLESCEDEDFFEPFEDTFWVNYDANNLAFRDRLFEYILSHKDQFLS